MVTNLPEGDPFSCSALPKIGRDGGPAMDRKEAMNTRLRIKGPMIATAMSATAMHIKINVLLSIVLSAQRVFNRAEVGWVTVSFSCGRRGLLPAADRGIVWYNIIIRCYY